LSGALDAVMARTFTLLKAVLSGRPRCLQSDINVSGAGHPQSPTSYVLLGLAEAIAKRIYRLCCYAPHWQVGWRYTNDAGIWSSRDLSGSPWAIIADPGHRFYADPFPVTWQGRTFIFFEDLDYRVGKGVISAVAFDGSGPVVPVLEEPCHLPYPFLIEADGELWMIPESSESRDVVLYRCIEFPNRWDFTRPCCPASNSATRPWFGTTNGFICSAPPATAPADFPTPCRSSMPIACLARGCPTPAIRSWSTAPARDRPAISSPSAGSCGGRCRTAAMDTAPPSASCRSASFRRHRSGRAFVTSSAQAAIGRDESFTP
jgi:hypothetical protein